MRRKEKKRWQEEGIHENGRKGGSEKGECNETETIGQNVQEERSRKQERRQTKIKY